MNNLANWRKRMKHWHRTVFYYNLCLCMLLGHAALADPPQFPSSLLAPPPKVELPRVIIKLTPELITGCWLNTDEPTDRLMISYAPESGWWATVTTGFLSDHYSFKESPRREELFLFPLGTLREYLEVTLCEEGDDLRYLIVRGLNGSWESLRFDRPEYLTTEGGTECVSAP